MKYDFIYVNPLINLLLWFPIIVVAIVLLHFLPLNNNTTIITYGLLGPISFFSYYAVLDKLLYPCFTYQGFCILQDEEIDFNFQFSKIKIPYAKIRDISYSAVPSSYCLKITTQWCNYAIEQSPREKDYLNITLLGELCELIKYQLILYNKRNIDIG